MSEYLFDLGATKPRSINRHFGSMHGGATAKDEWLTPPLLLQALGTFDLDPCAPIHRPWDTARLHYTVADDGLRMPWSGRVWCNPPYGPEARKWLAKLAEHGDGIALTFARTETKMFFRSVWGVADAILFIRDRINFCHVDGTPSDRAGAPSVLIAYGPQNADLLMTRPVDGFPVRLK